MDGLTASLITSHWTSGLPIEKSYMGHCMALKDFKNLNCLLLEAGLFGTSSQRTLSRVEKGTRIFETNLYRVSCLSSPASFIGHTSGLMSSWIKDRHICPGVIRMDPSSVLIMCGCLAVCFALDGALLERAAESSSQS